MSSGGSDDGINTSRFLSDGGTSVDLRSLAMVLAGIAMSTVGIGISTVIQSILAAPRMLFNALASFYVDVVLGVVGTLIEIGATGWSGLIGVVSGVTNPLVIVVAIALVLGYLVILREADDA
ncbi:hypothetical protein [Halolamina salifodinae]|uniref:Uncharacterized protein n=1 Tax=Halolamina salifodinae TaxID=1202767 RepID=A0A8T4GXA2_9EURY|nr:hypothetical protein [Halolamina salifodinae]MBP1985945.1 hypothetical protein [Halolamina salifodinae]